MLAHVFKVVIDPFIGKLGVFRVHQGTVTKDTQLFIGDGRKPFKVSHLFMIQGGKQVEIDGAVPGDIAAVAKVDEIEFDCVLHDSHDEDHIHMKPLEFPTPMHGFAIAPKKRGDEQRISDVLHKMMAEDPTLSVEHDTSLNETVLRGLGELHLRSVFERMASQFKLEIETRPPQRAVSRDDHGQGRGTSPAQEANRRRRDSSARSTCASNRCRAAADSSSRTQSRAARFRTSSSRRCKRASSRCWSRDRSPGFPLQDVRVTVYDGKHHPVDSKEIAFVTAGRKAFLDAIDKAKPIVLEPIVSLEVLCPEASMGDVAGDLSGRRGQVTGTKSLASRDVDGQRHRAAVGTRRLRGKAQGHDRRPRRVDDVAVTLRTRSVHAAASARERIRQASQARGRVEPPLHAVTIRPSSSRRLGFPLEP